MSVTKNRTNGDRPGEEMQSNKIPPAGAGLAGGRAARPTGTTTVTDRDEGERVTRAHAAPSAGGRRRPAAELVTPLLNRLFPRGVPIRFVFWDGSSVGPEDGPGGVTLHTPSALTRLLWAPGELGIARAFVAGDIDANGNAFEVLRLMHSALNQELGTGVGDLGTIGAVIRTAARLGVLGRPPEPPPEESRVRGWRHSKARDQQAVTHHYDVGNEFYRLVLGPTMTYSCARFTYDGASLEEAQAAKHELVCRKLGLAGGGNETARVLDVGCGWGSMVMHAAAEHGASVVGITLSPAQAELARQRVADAGLTGRAEIRIQDYRDLRGETFDAISSIGMFEHVGARRMPEYFETLAGLLRPGGRLLNHAISSVGGSKLSGRSFVGRYVFPDGELIDVADVVRAMERVGLEVRDVESLREHYSSTLHAWVHNLEENWDRAVALVGTRRARVWWLYMTASANGFDDGGLSIHQVLGVLPGPGGESGMPRTREGW